MLPPAELVGVHAGAARVLVQQLSHCYGHLHNGTQTRFHACATVNGWVVPIDCFAARQMTRLQHRRRIGTIEGDDFITARCSN